MAIEIRKQRSQRAFNDLVKDIVLTRHKKGWSQKRLAQAAGVSVTTVQRLEKADMRIKIETLFAILGALGILSRLEMALSSFKFKEERDFEYAKIARR